MFTYAIDMNISGHARIQKVFCQRGLNFDAVFWFVLFLVFDWGVFLFFLGGDGRGDPHTTMSGQSLARQRNAILKLVRVDVVLYYMWRLFVSYLCHLVPAYVILGSVRDFRSQGYKIIAFTTQLSMKFILLINVDI